MIRAVQFLILASLCVAQEPERPTFQTTVFGTTVVAPGSLEGKIYFIDPVSSLPKLSKLKPVGTIYAKALNVPLTEFRDGFPGITNRFEWFAIEYTGRFQIVSPGKYNFRLQSDDGSKLFIDGKLAIDCDGLGLRACFGSATLAAGVHDLRLDYFQGPRYHLALILEVKLPGATNFRVFNTDDFASTENPVSTSAPPTSAPLANLPPTPAIPTSEQRKVIEMAALRATAYASQLPDFLCTQLVDRTENRANSGWRPRDVLTLQLSFTGRAEHYQLIAVNNRPTKLTYQSVGGAVSGGEFGSFIAEIFQPHVAKFDLAGLDKIRDRTVLVFKYRIPEEKSQYAIQYRTTPALTQKLVVGHHGSVYLEPETGAIVRIVRIADLPHGIPIRDAYTTLDYGLSEVGGRTYMLPLEAENGIGTSTLQTRNHVRFLNYRKFDAGSKISFDDK